MVPSYYLIIAFVVGCVITLLFMKFIHRQKSEVAPEDIGPPLNEDEYEKKFEKIDEKYEAAMAQYDRLVPWVSGGALVLSLSFVENFSILAPSWSKYILGGAWLLLVGSLLSSIYSQYSSTRIKVWSKKYLQLRQSHPSNDENNKKINDWRSKALEYKNKTKSSARNTTILNVLAGSLLVAGLLALGAFAIFAVPFGTGVTK